MYQSETRPVPPLEIVKASEIEPKEVRWLWYPYIPFGKVTLVQGDPGCGKSTLMLSVAAKLTRGELLPFTEPEEQLPPMKVIYQTTEDDPEDTVVPRFLRAGGNPESLIFIKEDRQHLTFGDNRIREAILNCGAKVCILDPLSAYIGAGCNLNQAPEIRDAFSHLIGVARDTGCAVIVVAHMNKMRETSPIYRTPGSIDVAGAVRSILGVGRLRTDEADVRHVVQVKSNLSETGSSIRFSIGENGIVFESEGNVTAGQLFGGEAEGIGRPDEAFVKAQTFIRDMLKGGDLPAKECVKRLKMAGFKQSTYRKAKKGAGAGSVRSGNEWIWQLRKETDTDTENPPDITEYDSLPF